MSDANIVDSLKISVESTSEGANGSLDKLAENLTNLANALNGMDLDKVSAGFSALAQGITQVASATKDIDASALTAVSQAYDTLADSARNAANATARVRGGAKISTSDQSAPTTTMPTPNIIDPSGIDSATDSVNQLSESVNKIPTTPLERLTASAQSAGAAFKEAFSGTETGQQISSGVNAANSAMESLKSTAQSVGSSIRTEIADEAKYSPALIALSNLKDTFSAVGQSMRIAFTENNPALDRVSQVLGDISTAASAAGNAFRSSFANTDGIDAKSRKIQELIEKINQYKTTISGMDSGKTPFNLSEYNDAKKGLADATEKLKELKGEAASAPSILDKIVSALKKVAIAAAAFKVASAPFKLFTGLLKKGVGGIKEFGEKVSGAATKFTDFAGKVAQRFAFTLLRKAINAVIESLHNGIGALAQFDSAMARSFDANLGSHIAGLKAFGYQLIAAFAPIYNAIAPAVSYLIGLLNALAQAIAQIFSGLTGGKTWVKSIASTASYGASLEKSTGGAAKNAKEIKKQLAGFDRLNNLTSNDSGSGGGGGGGGTPTTLEPTFAEMDISPEMQKLIDKIKKAWKKADFTEIGNIFGKKVQQALNAIPWDFIQNIAHKVGKSFATFLNGFFETEGLGEDFGKAIGEAINTYIELIDSFFGNLHFENIGKFVGDALNGITDTINWEQIGEGWATKLNGLFDFLYGVAEQWDASATGEAMASALATAIEEVDWGKNGAKLATFLNDLFECLDSFLVNVPWGDLGEGIADDINEFFKTFDWNKAGKSLADFINGMFDFVNGLITKTDWKEIGGDIIEAIVSFFENIKWDKWGTTLTGILTGILDFLTGAIEKIKWDKIPTGIMDAIGDFIDGMDVDKLADSFFEFIGSALGAVVGLLAGTWDALEKVCKAIKDAFTKWFTDNALNDEGEFVIEGLLQGILDALKNIGTWVYDHVFKPILTGFTDAFLIGSPSKVMEDQGGFIMDGLFNGIDAGVDAIVGIFKTLKDTVVKKVEALGKDINKKWDTIKSKTTKAAETIKTKVSTHFTNMKTKVTTAVSNIQSTVKTKWDNVKSKLSENDFVATVKTAFGDIKSNIATNMKNAWSKTKQRWNSIKSKIEENGFVATAKESFDDIKGNIYTNISNSWAKVKKGWNNISTKLQKTGFKDTVTGAFSDIWSSIRDTMDNAWSKVKTVWSNITSKLSGGAKGTVTVETKETKANTKALGGAFYGKKWHDIPQFATGGVPNYGTAFIAGENGAEVVGHIGGRTEVLNQSQLASVMYESVNSAMAQQNALLREEIAYLKTIAAKDTTISSRDVFNAVRSESSDYKRRTGRLAFGV